MDPHEFRRQVMRRLRYGLNVVALERDLVSPEGPFDVALTNGLAAIVALDHPGAEKDQRGRMLSASALLGVLEDRGEALDYPALREALDITQPLRHGRADDEYLMPVQQHLEALIDLDAHPALLVLEQARATSKVQDLVTELYAEAASETTGLAFMSPKIGTVTPILRVATNADAPPSFPPVSTSSEEPTPPVNASRAVTSATPTRPESLPSVKQSAAPWRRTSRIDSGCIRTGSARC